MPPKHSGDWTASQVDALLYLALTVLCVSCKSQSTGESIEDSALSKVILNVKKIKGKLGSRKSNLLEIVGRSTLGTAKTFICRLHSKYGTIKNKTSRKPPSNGDLISSVQNERLDGCSPITATPPIMVDDNSSTPSTLLGSPISVYYCEEMMLDAGLPDVVSPDDKTAEDELAEDERPNRGSLEAQNGGAGPQLSDACVERMTPPELGTSHTDNTDFCYRLPSSSESNTSENTSVYPTQLESPAAGASFLDKLNWDNLGDEIETFQYVCQHPETFVPEVIDSDWASVCKRDDALDCQGNVAGIRGRIQKVILFRIFDAATRNRFKIHSSLQANSSRQGGPLSAAKIEMYKQMNPAKFGGMANSNDQYQTERRRISTAKRWNDIQRIFGWGGVVFHSWIEPTWFNRRVTDEKWQAIVTELQSVSDRFRSVVRSSIPKLAAVLLSAEISGHLLHCCSAYILDSEFIERANKLNFSS